MEKPTPEVNKETLKDIFDAKIYPRLFEGIKESYHPKAIFVGGQPGAGKSSRERILTLGEKVLHPEAVVEINGDDYRAFHPRYFEFMLADDSTAARIIDEDNAYIIELAIAAARNIRCNTIIEGTFRRPGVVIDTAAGFKNQEFAIHAICLAVHPLASRVSIMERYISQKKHAPFARFTPKEAHDASMNGIYATLSAVITQSGIDRLTLLARDNTVVADVIVSHYSAKTRSAIAEDTLLLLHTTHEQLPSEMKAKLLKQVDAMFGDLACLDIPIMVVEELRELRNDLLLCK